MKKTFKDLVLGDSVWLLRGSIDRRIRRIEKRTIDKVWILNNFTYERELFFSEYSSTLLVGNINIDNSIIVTPEGLYCSDPEEAMKCIEKDLEFYATLDYNNPSGYWLLRDYMKLIQDENSR